jgi:septal ring factor EnvC (AmiA/AmiB activator)
MPPHTCNQVERFNNLNQQLAEVKVDLDEHRHAQQLSDAERMEYREQRKEHDETIADQLASIKDSISELLELNKEVKDFKTAMRVGRNIGFGVATLITVMGVIFGGIYAVKEWIKR